MYNFGNSTYNKLGKQEQKNKYSLSDYSFNVEEKNDSHAIIVREIIKINKKLNILDVGCGSGIIGGYLKDYKNINLDAVEIDTEAIDEAKKCGKYNEIYNCSIESFLNNNPSKYDIIIFADLLEHLVNPYTVLKNIQKSIKKNGFILVSIPNIAHMDIIKNLINNNFNYNNVGTLDTTHLRFFTDNSFLEMINNINETIDDKFDVEFIDNTITYPDDINSNSKLSQIINEDEKKYTLQNIFKLKVSKSATNLKKLLNRKRHDIFADLSHQIDLIDESNAKIENYKIELSDKNNLILNLQNNINEMNRINKQLVDENKKLIDNYNSIINSKRWKAISKIVDMKSKIFKKR